ncbi:hypothetical protein GCK32_002653, partial [Trichostrongylus colubriformis]
MRKCLMQSWPSSFWWVAVCPYARYHPSVKVLLFFFLRYPPMSKEGNRTVQIVSGREVNWIVITKMLELWEEVLPHSREDYYDGHDDRERGACLMKSTQYVREQDDAIVFF